jgi:hypothetical protein
MTSSGIPLDQAAVVRAFGDHAFNLLRRGDGGSLSLSHDHWRLASADAAGYRFVAEAAEADPLTLSTAAIERIEWDRLPKQQVRSQVRFFLRDGNLWTFSGTVAAAPEPAR